VNESFIFSFPNKSFLPALSECIGRVAVLLGIADFTLGGIGWILVLIPPIALFISYCFPGFRAPDMISKNFIALAISFHSPASPQSFGSLKPFSSCLFS